jgi:hypothetical protein
MSQYYVPIWFGDSPQEGLDQWWNADDHSTKNNRVSLTTSTRLVPEF